MPECAGTLGGIAPDFLPQREKSVLLQIGQGGGKQGIPEDFRLRKPFFCGDFQQFLQRRKSPVGIFRQRAALHQRPYRRPGAERHSAGGSSSGENQGFVNRTDSGDLPDCLQKVKILAAGFDPHSPAGGIGFRPDCKCRTDGQKSVGGTRCPESVPIVVQILFVTTDGFFFRRIIRPVPHPHRHGAAPGIFLQCTQDFCAVFRRRRSIGIHAENHCIAPFLPGDLRQCGIHSDPPRLSDTAGDLAPGRCGIDPVQTHLTAPEDFQQLQHFPVGTFDRSGSLRRVIDHHQHSGVLRQRGKEGIQRTGNALQFIHGRHDGKVFVLSVRIFRQNGPDLCFFQIFISIMLFHFCLIFRETAV